MELTARLTGDAKISTLKDDRQVVNFSVAINENFKSKGKEQSIKQTTYVQCAYWINTRVAPFLTKGRLVELQGRIGANAYLTANGEPKATITMQVNFIKLHGGNAPKNGANINTIASTANEAIDDLSF